jgi:hypothetical protein
MPALPQADLPLRPPPLHARDSGGAGGGRGDGGDRVGVGAVVTLLARHRTRGYQAAGAFRA